MKIRLVAAGLLTPLDDYAERFFYLNAATFLNLGQYAKRRPPGDPVRKHVERVVATAKAAHRRRRAARSS